MTQDIPLAADETGIVRLFSVSMPAAEAKGLSDGDKAALLGLDRVDPAHAELVNVSDLAPLGLASYLTEGLGVRPEEVRAVRGRLDALEGHVLILRAAAHRGATGLRPDPRLTLIATLHEEAAAPAALTPLRSEGAKGTLSRPSEPEPTAAKGREGRSRWLILAAVILVVLAGLALLFGGAA
ncbi:hypothetical protein [Oceaniglobus roseus]|uniref:hypothetical protein n=1 Tax=Oceaniglobus roseus TaxID=1737570 RepID=UPI000C7EDA54|nr:hypothetical protein [Kandeliimicrobium roseum]